MNTELKNALQTVKRYCESPKSKGFYEQMDSASLKQRIETLKSNFLHYVDHQTIWYSHNQAIKNGEPFMKDHPNYINVALSKKQREDCIQSLEWFKRDIEACISHLQ